MVSDEDQQAISTPAGRLMYWLKSANETLQEKGNRPAIVTWADTLGVNFEADRNHGHSAVFGCGQMLMAQSIETRSIASNLPNHYSSSMLLTNFHHIEETLWNFAGIATMDSTTFFKPMREVVWSELSHLAYAMHMSFAEPAITDSKARKLIEQLEAAVRAVANDPSLWPYQKQQMIWHLTELINSVRQSSLTGTRPVARAVDATLGALARGAIGSITWLLTSDAGRAVASAIAVAASIVAIVSGVDSLFLDRGQPVIPLEQVDPQHADNPTYVTNIEEVNIEEHDDGPLQIESGPSEVHDGDVVDDADNKPDK